MHLAFLIVAIVMFVIATVAELMPTPPDKTAALIPLGWAFFVAAFLPGV